MFAIQFAKRSDAADVEWATAEIDQFADHRRAERWLCGGCTAPVQSVRGHTLRTGTWREAHFALRRPKSGERAQHDPDCTFNIARVIDEAVRDCRSIRPARTADRFELVIDEASVRSEQATDPPGDADEKDHDSPAAEPRRQVIGPHRRPTLLNDVVVVVQLLHRYYDDPGAESLFSAVWQPLSDRRRRTSASALQISWGDFYYPPDRHHNLVYRVLGSHQQPVHPTTVSGQIVHIRDSKDGARRDVFLALKDDAREAQQRLVLRGSPTIFGALAVDEAVAALATWKPFSSHRPGRPTVSYCTAWLRHPTQIQQIDPDLLDFAPSPP